MCGSPPTQCRARPVGTASSSRSQRTRHVDAQRTHTPYTPTATGRSPVAAFLVRNAHLLHPCRHLPPALPLTHAKLRCRRHHHHHRHRHLSLNHLHSSRRQWLAPSAKSPSPWGRRGPAQITQARTFVRHTAESPSRLIKKRRFTWSGVGPTATNTMASWVLLTTERRVAARTSNLPPYLGPTQPSPNPQPPTITRRLLIRRHSARFATTHSRQHRAWPNTYALIIAEPRCRPPAKFRRASRAASTAALTTLVPAFPATAEPATTIALHRTVQLWWQIFPCLQP
jgi:hypothetical protein